MRINRYCVTCWSAGNGPSGLAWSTGKASWRVCGKCGQTRLTNEVPVADPPVQSSPEAPADPQAPPAPAVADVILALQKMKQELEASAGAILEACWKQEEAVMRIFGGTGAMAESYRAIARDLRGTRSSIAGKIEAVQKLVGQLPVPRPDHRLGTLLDHLKTYYGDFVDLTDDQIIQEVIGSNIEPRDFVVQEGSKQYKLVRSRSIYTAREVYCRRNLVSTDDVTVTTNGRTYAKPDIDAMKKS